MGGDAEVRSQAESTTATLDRAILSFAGLDRGMSRSPFIDLAGNLLRILSRCRLQGVRRH